MAVMRAAFLDGAREFEANSSDFSVFVSRMLF